MHLLAGIFWGLVFVTASLLCVLAVFAALGTPPVVFEVLGFLLGAFLFTLLLLAVGFLLSLGAGALGPRRTRPVRGRR